MRHDYTHLSKIPAPRSLAGALFNRSRVDRLLRSMGAMFGVTYPYRGGYPLGTNTGIIAIPAAYNVAEIKLDFAAIALKRTAEGQAAFAAGDILQLFEIPAGTWVPAAFAETLTVEGETATYGVGDGAGTSGFLAAVDANALSGVIGSLATSAYSVAVGGGKVYSALDTIDVILNTAAFNVAKIRIMVAMVDMRSYRT